MKRFLGLALGLMLAIAGCSGKSGTTVKSGQAPGETSTAAAPAATNAANSGTTAVTVLPVYPGATKFGTQFMRTLTVCAHKITPVVYHVGDAEDKVVDWYVAHMPTAVKVQLPGSGTNGQGMTGYFMLSSDGRSSAVIEQMHFGSLEKTAQRFGMANKVILGLTRYDPPLSAEEVQLISQSGTLSGDTAAKAKAALKQHCGSGGFSFGG